MRKRFQKAKSRVRGSIFFAIFAVLAAVFLNSCAVFEKKPILPAIEKEEARHVEVPEGFFEMLNLDTPGLEKVKELHEAGTNRR